MHRFITQAAEKKALTLLKRIVEDLDPDNFTSEELRAEGLDDSASTVGSLRVDIDKCLPVLVELGHIERLRRGVYRVTDTGRSLDFSTIFPKVSIND